MAEVFRGWAAAVFLFVCFHATVGITRLETDIPPREGPEHRLYSDLFTNYTAESRPVRNASHTVVVTFALSLNQLLDLDEKNQILTTSVWIYEEWTDEMLKWLPEKYEGQKAIMIPATSIWLPDIFIFNTAGANMDGFVSVNGSKVAIQNDGSVRWMVPLMVASVCAVDVTYFPYDRQTCSIKFGSWIYDIDQLDIVSEATEPDLEHYVMNSEYDLRNVSISRGVLDSSCCPGDGRHSMVEVKIELRRKSLYYDYIVIAPTIMLCVLTLASFLLPCDRGEKMAIGLTVFLTLYVLQLRIADNVPDTNSTPILGVFMLIVMTFNCVSLIMATIVMNIKKRGDDSPCPDVPTWLFIACHHIIGRIVCTRYLWQDQIHLPPDAAPSPVKAQTQSPGSTGKNQVRRDEKERAGTDRSTKVSSPFRHNKSSATGSGTTKNQKNDENNTESNAQSSNAVRKSLENQNQSDKLNGSRDSEGSAATANHCYDPHKTPHPQSEGDAELRLRKPKATSEDGASTNQNQHVGGAQNSRDSIMHIRADVRKGYIMKRRWFYVAEVVDKFLFLVYLILLTCSIFTVLFLIPVYFRNDN